MKKTIFLLTGILLLFVVHSCSKTEHEMFATLYGVVTDSATGDPIANASVVLLPSGKTKITGTDGRYEFNDLDPQQYILLMEFYCL